MNLDALTPSKFWDLVYETAKFKKTRKKLWKTFMSPEYVDRVYNEADFQLRRINAGIENMRNDFLDTRNPVAYEKKLKAQAFIVNIKNTAKHYKDKYRNQGKVVAQYARMNDALLYIEYLKDTIQDLSTEYNVTGEDFLFSASLEQYLNREEVSLNRWMYNRKNRGM